MINNHAEIIGTYLYKVWQKIRTGQLYESRITLSIECSFFVKTLGEIEKFAGGCSSLGLTRSLIKVHTHFPTSPVKIRVRPKITG